MTWGFDLGDALKNVADCVGDAAKAAATCDVVQDIGAAAANVVAPAAEAALAKIQGDDDSYQEIGDPGVIRATEVVINFGIPSVSPRTGAVPFVPISQVVSTFVQHFFADFVSYVQVYTLIYVLRVKTQCCEETSSAQHCAALVERCSSRKLYICCDSEEIRVASDSCGDLGQFMISTCPPRNTLKP